MSETRTEPGIQALVIEDDPEFRGSLAAALGEAGIASVEAEDAERGLAALRANPCGTFDVVLLDVDARGRSAWEVLPELRASDGDVPVLCVTGQERVEERAKGLRLGADDWLARSAGLRELIARVEAAVHRRRALRPVAFGDLRVDLARRLVERGGAPVDLTTREFDLLLALLRADGCAVSRDELLRLVWDLDFDPGTALLDALIARVRRKLDRHGPPAIRTVEGAGYALVRHRPG